MTRTCKLAKASIEEKAKASFKSAVILLTIVLFSLVLLAFRLKNDLGWSQGYRGLVAKVPYIAIVIYVGSKRIEQQERESWESYEIQWNKDMIEKTQVRMEDICIVKSEITAVLKHEGGMTIEAGKESRKIFIPNTLEGFSELAHEFEIEPNRRII